MLVGEFSVRRAVLVGAGLVAWLGAAPGAWAQMSFTSQTRSVSAQCTAAGQSQSSSAPDFNAFNGSAIITTARATQSSTLAAGSIVASGSTVCPGGGACGVCGGSGATASSTHNVAFTIAQDCAFTLQYLGTNGPTAPASISLIGPTITIAYNFAQESGASQTRTGTMTPGTYTLHASAGTGLSGGDAFGCSWSVNLSVNVLGSCCIGGACTQTIQSACTGLWSGAGSCSPNVCAPANDMCASASGIGLGNTAFSTVYSTMDGPDPQPECDPLYPRFFADVWYGYTPSQAGVLTVSTCNQASFDTKVAAYTGGCGALTLSACSEDGPGCANYTSVFSTTVTAGQPLLIRVGSYDGGQGTGTLTLSLAPVGSCCGTYGVCSVTTQSTCPGGWFGGSACPDYFCLPAGSCCAASGCSSVTPSGGCAGTWLSGTCTPDACVPGTCCSYSTMGIVCAISLQSSCSDFTWMATRSCSPNPCVTPAYGVCCPQIPPFDCAVTTQQDCSSNVWVPWGTCTTSGFPRQCQITVGVGTCCGVNGGCTVSPAGTCDGSWLPYTPGPNGCGSTTCPAPTGACCYGATCTVTTFTGCGAGTFAGANLACNTSGGYPCCRADFNQVAGVTVQDIFDFLNSWFAGEARADADGSGDIAVQDIFSFLNTWFAGC